MKVLLFLFFVPTFLAQCDIQGCEWCTRYGVGCGWCNDTCQDNQTSCVDPMITNANECPAVCQESPYESSLCLVPNQHDIKYANFIFKCAIWNGLEGEITTTETGTSFIAGHRSTWKSPSVDFDSPECAQAVYAWWCALYCRPCRQIGSPCSVRCEDVRRLCPVYMNKTGWNFEGLICYEPFDGCSPGGVGPDFNEWMKDGFPLDWKPASSSSSQPRFLLSSPSVVKTVCWFLILSMIF
jgi:hypothetical protein